MHFHAGAVAEGGFQEGELRAVEGDYADVLGGQAGGEEGFDEEGGEAGFGWVGEAVVLEVFVGEREEGVGVYEDSFAGGGEEVVEPAAARGGGGADIVGGGVGEG